MRIREKEAEKSDLAAATALGRRRAPSDGPIRVLWHPTAAAGPPYAEDPGRRQTHVTLASGAKSTIAKAVTARWATTPIPRPCRSILYSIGVPCTPIALLEASPPPEHHRPEIRPDAKVT